MLRGVTASPDTSHTLKTYDGTHPRKTQNPILRSILAENRVHLKDAPRHGLSVSIGKSSVTESVT